MQYSSRVVRVVVAFAFSAMNFVQAQTTTRASVSSAGIQGDQASATASLSADGQFIAFQSGARNLLPGPPFYAFSDVYVRDRQLGTTEAVAIDSNGVHQPGYSATYPTISDDGRFVAFETTAPLVPADTNGQADAYVRDRQTGTTERVSQGQPPNSSQIARGGRFPTITGNGRFVVFTTDDAFVMPPATGDQLYLRDRQLATTELVSVSSSGVPGATNGAFAHVAISSDGRFVAFCSGASTLVTGDTNGVQDVFIRDRQQGTTELASLTSTGVQANGGSGNGGSADRIGVSLDGRFVAFDSYATNLVANDTNNSPDVFLRDRLTGTTVRVSVDSFGLEGDGNSISASMSADGNRIAFYSSATNFVLHDFNGLQDAFLHEVSSGRTIRVSVSSGGGEANGTSPECAISADGSAIGFSSQATNLISGDTNNRSDVFVHEPDRCPPAVIYCAAKLNSLGCLPVIGSIGVPSTTAGSGFDVTCTNIRNNKPGLLFYSINGRLNTPFQGGTLCVASPIRRAPAQQSGGNPPPAIDCSGAYSTDFNAFAVGSLGGTPLFDLQIPGTKVNCQWWGRDPGFPHPLDTMLSEGLEFFMCP